MYYQPQGERVQGFSLIGRLITIDLCGASFWNTEKSNLDYTPLNILLYEDEKVIADLVITPNALLKLSLPEETEYTTVYNNGTVDTWTKQVVNNTIQLSGGHGNGFICLTEKEFNKVVDKVQTTVEQYLAIQNSKDLT